MRKIFVLGTLLAGVALTSASQANAAGIGSWQTTVIPSKDVQLVRRDWHGGGGPHNWGVRGWHHRPYYGNVVAGIAIGTIIAAAAANAAPEPPGPNLCWYWTNPRHTHGYWDYCG
jgi:hypothetical protein